MGDGDGDGGEDMSWRRNAGSSSKQGEAGSDDRGDDGCVAPLIVLIGFGGEAEPMEAGGEESGEESGEICDNVLLICERSYTDSA